YELGHSMGLPLLDFRDTFYAIESCSRLRIVARSLTLYSAALILWILRILVPLRVPQNDG
ncbi:MAG: hypothetical protein WA869_26300, partial [Alloacidobacterium sp.]